MIYADIMTFDEFKLFRNLIHNECGIFLKDAKRDFLKTKVEKRLKTLNIKSYFAYYRLIKDKENKAEFYELLDSITINETCFFRNTSQFELLREKAIPELIARKQRTGSYSLTMWSAGCSTGEEPYSMAIEALDNIPNISSWNVQIIASDISMQCIEIAQCGSYSAERLRDVPEKYLVKYFINSGDLYHVKDDVKRFVVFDYHNLKHENGLANVDILFCRNVMIYFDAAEQRRIISRFQSILNPGGYFFLGHAESLYGMTDGDFKFIYWKKGTAYQKVK